MSVLSRLSASALPRIFACPASAVLPGNGRESEAASRGTVVHSFLERINRGRRAGQSLELARDEALAETPQEHIALCAMLDVESILSIMPLQGERFPASEVQLVYDPATDRAWTPPKDEPIDRTRLIPGRADLLGAVSPSVVYGGDFKSGRYRGRARENWQFRFLALAAVRAAGADEAIFEAIYVDPTTGESWRDRAEFDYLDIESFAEALRELVQRVGRMTEAFGRGEMPSVSEGAHCDYCPAFNGCPAKKALALLVARGEGIAADLPSLDLTVEDARRVLEKIRLVRQVVGRVESVIYAMAKQAPIPLGDGTVLGEHLKLGRREIDGRKAHAILAEQFGRDIADAAVQLEASQSGMRQVLAAEAKKSGKFKITHAMKFVMDELEAREGISRAKKLVVEVFDPQKKQLSAGED